jgi:hypothetical protein
MKTINATTQPAPVQRQEGTEIFPHRARSFACKLLLRISLVLALAMAQTPVYADHGGPYATSVAELLSQFGLRLEELAAEFGFDSGESPAFDEDTFNRLMRKSRMLLDQSINHVDRDQICKGLYKLARSVYQLENAADYGAGVNMSGWGFAEDLASLASFIAESFLEDLIVLSDQEGAGEEALTLAREAETTGDMLRMTEEWAAATEQFANGTCALL